MAHVNWPNAVCLRLNASWLRISFKLALKQPNLRPHSKPPRHVTKKRHPTHASRWMSAAYCTPRSLTCTGSITVPATHNIDQTAEAAKVARTGGAIDGTHFVAQARPDEGRRVV